MSIPSTRNLMMATMLLDGLRRNDAEQDAGQDAGQFVSTVTLRGAQKTYTLTRQQLAEIQKRAEAELNSATPEQKGKFEAALLKADGLFQAIVPQATATVAAAQETAQATATVAATQEVEFPFQKLNDDELVAMFPVAKKTVSQAATVATTSFGGRIKSLSGEVAALAKSAALTVATIGAAYAAQTGQLSGLPTAFTAGANTTDVAAVNMTAVAANVAAAAAGVAGMFAGAMPSINMTEAFSSTTAGVNTTVLTEAVKATLSAAAAAVNTTTLTNVVEVFSKDQYAYPILTGALVASTVGMLMLRGENTGSAMVEVTTTTKSPEPEEAEVEAGRPRGVPYTHEYEYV